METKLKYFTIAKIYPIVKKILWNKRNQNPSRYYYNSIITNLKFQHKAKNSHIKIDLIIIIMIIIT
jgi:hypothetical protein